MPPYRTPTSLCLWQAPNLALVKDGTSCIQCSAPPGALGTDLPRFSGATEEFSSKQQIPVSSSSVDRLLEAAYRALPLLPETIRKQVAEMLTPEAMCIIAGVALAWAGSHVFGIGEIIDVMVGGVTVITVGWDAIKALRGFAGYYDDAVHATNDAEIDAAAQQFATAVSAAAAAIGWGRLGTWLGGGARRVAGLESTQQVATQLARWRAYIEAIEFDVPLNKGMLWSSLSTNYVQGLAQKKGLTTLEMVLERNGFFPLYQREFGGAKNELTKQIWVMISRKFVQSLEGEVTGYIHNIRYFDRIKEAENPKLINEQDPVLVQEVAAISEILLSNQRVTKFTLIDANTGEIRGYRIREILESLDRIANRPTILPHIPRDLRPEGD